MPLLDAQGQPIDTSVLDEEIATVARGTRRTPFDHEIVLGLTPQRLAAALAYAADGEPEHYLSIAERLELRDAHYRSVLQTRKLAVSQLAIVVDPASEDARDVEIAAFVSEHVKSDAFDTVIPDALDALSKGFSVQEIMWQTSPDGWIPVEYKWRDPRHFRFDRETLSEIRLISDDNPEGVPLPFGKFVCHIPRIKSGIPIKGGLAWVAATLHLIKSYAVKDWAAFADVFGLPVRIGKYRKGTSAEEIKNLRSALRAIGTDASAVLSESVNLEVLGAPSAGGSQEFFERLANWLNKEISKLVLGQTMTVEDGSSLAQATIHDRVRSDLRNADAKQVARTINRDIIGPLVSLNYGGDVEIPRLHLDTSEPEDLEALSRSLPPFIDRGLPVAAEEIRAKFGLGPVEAGAAVLTPEGAATVAPLPDGGA